MYGLSDEDLAIQARARGFADELIPFEEQAEAAGGELPADVTAGHAKRARELGLHSTNMPAELGGGGCTTLQQVLVQEQVGRVTNALGWVAATPPSWLPEVATADQVDRYVRPAIDGEREECYAITEEGAGSDVDAIEATAHRDGDEYVLERGQVARHLVQHRRLRLLPGPAARRPARRRARHVPGRPAQPRRPGGPDPGLLAHDQPPPPDRRVRGRARPGREPGRGRGRRDDLRVRVVQVRAADGRRPLPRAPQNGSPRR